MTLRLTHASGRFDRSPASLHAALDDLAPSADVLTGTEVANPTRAKMLAMVLRALVHFPGETLGETFISVRKAYGTVTASDVETVSTLRFRRHGWAVPWAVVEPTDGSGPVLVTAAHTPASWRILRQRKAWRDGVAHWSALLDRLASQYDCRRVVVAADWNRNLASRAVRRELEAAFDGFTVVAPDKPTHDVRRIDGLLVKGYTGTGHTLDSPVLRAASDHRPAAFTLTPTDSTPPTPAPQEAPVTVKPPSPPLIPARWHGGKQTPRAIVIHGTVSPCVKGGARAIANYFAHEDNQTSAHYVVDPGEVIQCVGDHTIAYHCGYNTGSIGVELCDPQAGADTRWHDADHKAMLGNAAVLVAQLCLAYGIDIEHVHVAALQAHGPHGIYSHNQSRLAFGHTTHTDPGEAFPWNGFIAQVRAAAADLAAGDRKPAPSPAPKPARPSVSVQAGRRIGSLAKTVRRARVKSLLRSIANRLIQKG